MFKITLPQFENHSAMKMSEEHPGEVR